MNALEALLALAQAADKLGLGAALSAIRGEAGKAHPELVPAPPVGERAAIDADIDAELARRGRGGTP